MDIDKIEQQRRQLEVQVAKLRDSLKHWQLWDAEYEGLKEEIQLNKERNLTRQSLTELSTSYAGSLVNEKEICDIAGLSSGGSLRTRQQILDLIDHRLVYVTKNIETLSRQYYAAEGKLEEFDFAAVLAAGDDARFGHLDDSHESQLIEIHEELDDDDNVIKGELRRPDIETQKILDKIAARDHSSAAAPVSTTAKPTSITPSSSQSYESAERASRRPPIRKKSVSFSADTKAPEKRESSEAPDGRKSVSFAAKVAIAPAAAPPDNRSVSFASSVEEIPASETPATPVSQKTVSDSTMQEQLRPSFKPGETVYELNEDEEPVRRHIVLPPNESAADADMRRLMLNYHLNEVGSVMADMDADEGDGYGDDRSDFTSSENLDDPDTPYTTGTSDDDEEEEDEFGRTKGSGITDQYRLQMSALSARLMSDGNQKTSSTSPQEAAATTTDLPIRSGRSSMSSADSGGLEYKERPNNKKRVSFAETLDVATEADHPAKVQKALSSSPHPLKLTDSFSDASTQQRVDEDEEESDHQSPSGPVVSDTLVERIAKHSTPSAPTSEDPDMLMSRRELATEYYRQRNNMVREQGGFGSGERAGQNDEQLYEERDGKAKKVSRFKAARLHS